MFSQLDNFEQYQRRLTALVGAQRAKQLVNQALVLITVGGNDFVNNYYLVPFSARSRQFSLPNYVKYLIVEYEKLLQVDMIICYLGYLFWFYMHTMYYMVLFKKKKKKGAKCNTNIYIYIYLYINPTKNSKIIGVINAIVTTKLTQLLYFLLG
jgi:hypothetical protein